MTKSKKSNKGKIKPRHKRHLKTLWFIIGAFLTLWAGYDLYQKYFKPPLQQAEEEKYVTGLFLPDALLKSDEVSIQVGTLGLVYNIQSLIEGVDLELDPRGISCGNESSLPSVRLKIMNNRLYIRDSIIYLENNEIIGVINYDHWELIKDQYLHCVNCTEQKLEVIDKQGHIALQLSYINPNVISLRGYFISNHFVNVSTIDGFIGCISKRDPGYKERVREILEK